jgi:hypothetical protein
MSARVSVLIVGSGTLPEALASACPVVWMPRADRDSSPDPEDSGSGGVTDRDFSLQAERDLYLQQVYLAPADAGGGRFCAVGRAEGVIGLEQCQLRLGWMGAAGGAAAQFAETREIDDEYLVFYCADHDKGNPVYGPGDL